MRGASALFSTIVDEVCEDLACGLRQSDPATRAANQCQADQIVFYARGASGGPALVTMVKATELRNRDNRADIRGLYIARFRTILLKS